MLARHDRSRFSAVIARLSPRSRSALIFAAALAAILLATWWCYRPGLSGDFLFDDFANLPALGATGPIDNRPAFWRYITSGTADPTGRPLTLLSFLIDAHDWPASPYPFKVTNILLHLLNGALLYAVLLRLGGALASGGAVEAAVSRGRPDFLSSFRTPRSGDPESALPNQTADFGFRSRESANDPGMTEERRRLRTMHTIQVRIAALFGAGAWLLHPLFVSTTLYIVQREAMLPATFVLLGMLGWIAARTALASGHVQRGSLGMLLAAWGCTLLATLSKANGALLPLLLLLTEWIVLAPARPMPAESLERLRARLTIILLGLPSALLAIYMLVQLPALIEATPGIRNWTLGQRVLSEPRALCDYLALLLRPRLHSTGLFTDGFSASRSLFEPASTLPCIAVVLGLVGLALALRKRHPAISIALLFYFAGHLLESTWIPLELYYEHRNYLPAMLLFWPIGIWLGAPGALRWLRGACAAAVLAWLAVLTFQRASLWGDAQRQAQVWAAFNPDSARAQTNAALDDLEHGHPRLAAARLRNALPDHPHDVQIPANLITAECRMHALRPQSVQALRDALATSKVGGTVGFNWFNQAIGMAKNGECPGLDFAAVQSLLDAARRNPWWARARGEQQDLAHLQGVIDLAQGNPTAALQAFDRALALKPRADSALTQAAMLGAHGYPALGLAHLDYWATLPPAPKPRNGMPAIHAWVLDRQQYWQDETARLRATLQRDAARQAGGKTASATANALASG